MGLKIDKNFFPGFHTCVGTPKKSLGQKTEYILGQGPKKNWSICRPVCSEINFFTQNIGMFDWFDTWTYIFHMLTIDYSSHISFCAPLPGYLHAYGNICLLWTAKWLPASSHTLSLFLSLLLPLSSTVHNVYILEYLFLRPKQAGIYLKICHLLYHSTYICPILFSPKEHGEILIFMSLKL